MKIYIWGTGQLAGIAVDKYINWEEVEGFVDNNEQKKEHLSKKVILPEKLKDLEYDAVVVANSFSKEIYDQSIKLRLDISKFIFLYNNFGLIDMNTNYDLMAKIVGGELADVIKKRSNGPHMIAKMGVRSEFTGVKSFDNLCFRGSKYEGTGYFNTDYVRILCLEFAVKEIRKRGLLGNVAELGVFRGDFAQYINFAFPDRKCYLFDTFDGFDEDEALKEIEKGHCTAEFVEGFKNTNIKLVLDKMPNLDNVIIKQGYFPESVGDLEEKFVFVSLDVDFESSIYEGLKYFYPRLVEGGYLFIHDYNEYSFIHDCDDASLLGVEAAVDRYEADYGVMLCKVPICDEGGTLIVTK